MSNFRRWNRVLSIALVVLGLPLSDAAADWRPFGLQGATVRALAVAPGEVCAATQGRGVFCLEFRAPQKGWQPLGLEGIVLTGLWVDPTRTGVMFAASGGSNFDAALMFRTLDGGSTWERIDGNFPPGPGFRVLQLVQGVPGTSTVYAAGGSVWRSDDLGRTWRNLLSEAWQVSLEISPTDPSTVWAGGDLAFAFVQEGYLALTRNGGVDWDFPWAEIGVSLADIAAHPGLDGLVLVGLSGSVLRTDDHGARFASVLKARGNLLVDWSPAGRGVRPASSLGLAVLWNWTGALDLPLTYVSRDAGRSWTPLRGDALRARRLYDLETDDRWPGVAYVATDDGVYVFFGAGLPLCHDARRGVDETIVWPGECPPILSPGPVRLGDTIAVAGDMVRPAPDRVDLGAVNCLIEDADIAFATVDPPDPPPGEVLLILSREEGTDAYGRSSDGLPRLATNGDCR